MAMLGDERDVLKSELHRQKQQQQVWLFRVEGLVFGV